MTKNKNVNDLYTFTNNKETFIDLLTSSSMDCAITNERELLIWDTTDDTPWDCAHEQKPKITEAFSITLGFDVVTLKKFMDERYPDVDVDVEFETNSPGVFRRLREFSDDAGYEFKAYEQQKVFELLMTNLEEMGYRLTFEN